MTCEKHTNKTSRISPATDYEIILTKVNGEAVGGVKDGYLQPGVYDLVFELVLPNNGAVQSQGGLVGALIAGVANAGLDAMQEQQRKKSRSGITLCAGMGEKYTVRYYQRVNRAWYWIERTPDGLLVAGKKAGPALYDGMNGDELLALYRDEKDDQSRMNMLDDCTNQVLQNYAALNDPDDDVQHRAVRAVTDPLVLATIAQNESENYAVRGEAIMHIEDPTLLEELAAKSSDQAVQREAQRRLKYLSTKAKAQDTRDGCNQAIRRLIETKQWD